MVANKVTRMINFCRIEMEEDLIGGLIEDNDGAFSSLILSVFIVCRRVIGILLVYFVHTYFTKMDTAATDTNHYYDYTVYRQQITHITRF